MRNKRGLLLAESTLKIIVAILCIILLVFLLFSLYSSFKSNEEIEQAKSSISRIEVALDEAEEKGESEVIILEPVTTSAVLPKGLHWWIVSWPPENQEVIPKICENNRWENCLCICQSNFWFGAQGGANKCDTKGACTEVKTKIITSEKRFFTWIQEWKNTAIRPLPIVLDDPPINLKIKYENNQFEVIR